MLRKTMEWREANDVESVTKWQVPQDIREDFRLFFSGLDNQGFPGKGLIGEDEQISEFHYTNFKI
jgi:hypothetical protein